MTVWPTRLAIVLSIAACLAWSVAAQAESAHIFGLHWWDRGGNVDVMSHRTGWVVEANLGRQTPDIARLEAATAEGFTIMQRLDWDWDFDVGTVPKTGGEQMIFANQCRNWASQIKDYCRYYVIGNEMELHDGVTVQVYANAFTLVRDAIKQVQPDAYVVIGHFNSDGNLDTCMSILGNDGHDGIAKHTNNFLDDGLLDLLDQHFGSYRPDVGLYITEWGWGLGGGTDPDSFSKMQNFYEEIGQSNASRLRQCYCACWYAYPQWSGSTFSLYTAGVNGFLENPAFEAATALGTSFNSYADNPIIMTDLYADLPAGSNSSIAVNWNTNLPARTQIWWKRYNETFGHGGPLNKTLSTSHSETITGLWAQTEYEVQPGSTADDLGDAGGRRYRVKVGYWDSAACEYPGPDFKAQVSWDTDWPTDSKVQYGATPDLGLTVHDPTLVTDHHVMLTNLSPGIYHYRILSSEDNPEVNGPRLYMRSDIRTFTITGEDPDDSDGDGVPDGCDQCPDTPIGAACDDDGCPLPVPADFDGDLDVDQGDFGHLQICLTGTGVPQPDPNCQDANLDGDDDVDQDDLMILRDCLSGANVPGEPACYTQ